MRKPTVYGVVGALVFPAAAQAAVVQLGASRDNTLFESSTGTLSNGSGSHLFVGTTAFGEIRRTLIAFDIADHIPASSTITAVTLGLNVSRTATASEVVDVYRLLNDWGEGASRAAGEEGGGAAAISGDATWAHTFFDDRFWTQAGGDYDPSLSTARVVVAEGWYTWASTPELVADVQGWLDDPTTNHGWLLRGNESSFQTAKRFDSREHPNPDRRPVLTVEYTPVPEPTTILLLSAGMAVVIGRRYLGRSDSKMQRSTWWTLGRR